VRRIRAILDQSKGASALPTHLETSSQFVVSHVQVTLRLLDAGVAEDQLDDADVDAVGEQARGAFVSQVMPSVMSVDLPELLAVPEDAVWPSAGFETIGQQRSVSPAVWMLSTRGPLAGRDWLPASCSNGRLGGQG
jgi:hypothetical protein